jgi:phosphatidate cytidylyltransferase
MLRTRVITAVAVLLVVVGMLFFAPANAWSLFVLAIALAASWEWSRLCGLGRVGQSVFLLLSGVLGGALWMTYLRASEPAFRELTLGVLVVAALFWIVAAPLWLRLKWRPAPALAAAAGWIVVWPTWFAFVALREIGPWVLLAVAAIVWIADIAAYFAGRRFGRRKLAPAVSPGKTWEGVYGALAGVALYGVILAAVTQSAGGPLAALFAPAVGVPAIAAMMLLTVLSVVGDLLESWMKRGAGRKDSSRLLPGHGGVLDRIDALTSTLPVATLAISLATRSFN